MAGGERESAGTFEAPPLVEPGGLIAREAELAGHPTKKFRLLVDQGFGPKPAEALLVKYGGGVRAFLNVCPHVGTPLDWMPNEFFDAENERLMCRTHGALFDPLSGDCLAGPCAGKALTPVAIERGPGGEIRLAKAVRPPSSRAIRTT